MTVDDDRPGSKPPDDDRLRTLRRACSAARQVECGTCWTGPIEECVYTTAPVSVPVTPGTPMRPVRGYHAARLRRAASEGLTTAADLEAVVVGLADAAVVWDDGSAPRPAPAREPLGPFETGREAREVPAVRTIYAATRASNRRGVMGERNHQLLEEACTAAGVELGAYDRRILLWMAGWEPETCAVVAGWVSRGRRDTGLTDADLAVVRQALADASAWRTWPDGGDRDTNLELATAYEQLLRRLVTGTEGS